MPEVWPSLMIEVLPSDAGALFAADDFVAVFFDIAVPDAARDDGSRARAWHLRHHGRTAPFGVALWWHGHGSE